MIGYLGLPKNLPSAYILLLLNLFLPEPIQFGFRNAFRNILVTVYK